MKKSNEKMFQKATFIFNKLYEHGLRDIETNFNNFNFFSWRSQHLTELEILMRKYKFSISSGVSKLVIVLDDEDFVIKIPYHYTSSFYMREADSLEGFDNDVYERREDGLIVENCKSEDFFYAHDIQDYCAEEARLYKQFVENGVERFFAESRFLDSIITDSGVEFSFYAMEKVFAAEGLVSRTSRKLYKKRQKGKKDKKSLGLWMEKVALMFMGKEEAENFIDVTDSFSINDLHLNNFGFLNGKLVCIDYSGFED